MPAYRSQAEADIREPTVDRLRQLMPGARIIHEINCASFGPNRIDVLAVSKDRIAAAEIKSSRDKIDRLQKQLSSMLGCAHHAIAALHGKFFEVKEVANFGTMVCAPKEAEIGVVWGFGLPKVRSAEQYQEHRLSSRWDKRFKCLPPSAINLLWREELREIASRRKLHKATSRLTMPEIADVIAWNLSGSEITKEICASLRRRNCVEADPAIDDQAPHHAQERFDL